MGGPAADVGARAIGTSTYPVPATGVIFVATTGSDANVGTLAAPVATMQRAVNLASTGTTIVVRGGSYNTPWSCSKANITVQPYPNETVWFDGTVVLTGFTASTSAATWFAPWVLVTDHSPSPVSGALESTEPGWYYTDPLYPTAPWPEMVFLDGVALTRVATEAEVVPGTFYVRGTASGTNSFTWTSSHIVIGDDPTGREVRVTNTAKGTGSGSDGRGCALTGANITIRGVGWRRWGTHIGMRGIVYANGNADNLTIEHCVFEDSTGMGLGAANGDDVTIRHCTIRRHGIMGLYLASAWRVTVEDCLIVDNNTRYFRFAPESGDIKCGRVRDSIFRRNRFGGTTQTSSKCSGLWFDVVCYNVQVYSNDFRDCGHHGLIWEISTNLIAADNLFSRVADMPFRCDSSSGVEFWNNTIVDCSHDSDRGTASAPRPMWLVRSTRVYLDLLAQGNVMATDSRRPQPDPTISWELNPHRQGNNAWGPSPYPGELIRIQNSLNNTPYSGMGIMFAGGTIYNRVTGLDPTTALFSRPTGAIGGVTPAATLASWQAFSGQDVGSVSETATRIVTAEGVVTSLPVGLVRADLPAAVAAVLPTELVDAPRVGAWR